MIAHHQPRSDHERVDALLQGLGDEHCRATLGHLRDSDAQSATLDDLASAIADHDRDDETTVAIRLHHSVLPRLEDAGVVEYDARSHTARYRCHPGVESLIDSITDR